MVMEPLALADFWDLLPVAALDWPPLPSNAMVTDTNDGLDYAIARGVRRWSGSVSVALSSLANGAEIDAIIGGLSVPGASFWVSPLHRPRPASVANPAAGARIGWRSVDGSQVSFGALVVGDSLRRGEFFSYVTPDGRARLHCLLGSVTAGVGGVTGPVGVSPALDPSAILSQWVRLDRPQVIAKIVPQSIKSGDFLPTWHGGVSFAWRESRWTV